MTHVLPAGQDSAIVYLSQRLHLGGVTKATLTYDSKGITLGMPFGELLWLPVGADLAAAVDFVCEHWSGDHPAHPIG